MGYQLERNSIDNDRVTNMTVSTSQCAKTGSRTYVVCRSRDPTCRQSDHWSQQQSGPSAGRHELHTALHPPTATYSRKRSAKQTERSARTRRENVPYYFVLPFGLARVKIEKRNTGPTCCRKHHIFHHNERAMRIMTAAVSGQDELRRERLAIPDLNS